MDATPSIALIGDNTLMLLGLRGLLESLMPTVDVRTYTTVAELHADERRGKHFFHYFVMTRAVLTDIAFFTQNSKRCIVLTDNTATLLPAEFRTLDMSQSEAQLVRAIMLMQHHGHKGRSVPQGAHPHALPAGAVSKQHQRQAQWQQMARAEHPASATQPHATEQPAEHPTRHPDILDMPSTMPPTSRPHTLRHPQPFAIEPNQHVLEHMYSHPDILPPSGIPAQHNRTLPQYSTSHLHPDVIEVGSYYKSHHEAPSAEASHSSGHPAPPEVLTKREREVLVLMVKGYINKQIATQLNIGLTTVISHRRNLVEKLGMRSISALTIYAVTHGLIPIEDIEEKGQ